MSLFFAITDFLALFLCLFGVSFLFQGFGVFSADWDPCFGEGGSLLITKQDASGRGLWKGCSTHVWQGLQQ